MKILIVASTMGHINNFHMPYIEKLKEDGHTVHTLTGTEGSSFTVDLVKKTLSLKNLKAKRQIRRVLTAQRYDAVFVHTSLAAFWLRMAMKGMKNRPYVINTVHGYLFGKDCGKLHNMIYLACERFLKKQTDDIIVMNNEDYDIATGHKLCKGNVYYSNGMGVGFKQDVGEAVKADGGEASLLFVGEISKRKNQAFLVDAMKQLDGCTLTLVGSGAQEYVCEIENKIKEEKLEGRVRLVGQTSQVYEYIKGCDVYVSASQIEGLPFNIMEAMYMKKPIVASNVKGHSDLLGQDCLYDLGDKDAFVSLVRAALEKNTVEYDIEKYRLENVLAENMEIYRAILDKKQPVVVNNN